MRRVVLAAICAAFLISGTDAAAAHTSVPRGPCNHKCQFKRDQVKLRAATDRNPIPSYIVACESGGNYRAINRSSGAGGKYQVLPSTWASEVIDLRHYIIRLAGGDHGPQLSSPLLQDKVAAMVWADSGPGAWSCS